MHRFVLCFPKHSFLTFGSKANLRWCIQTFSYPSTKTHRPKSVEHSSSTMNVCVFVGLSMLVALALAEQNDVLGSLFAMANEALGDGKSSVGNNEQKSSLTFGMDSLLNMATGVLGAVTKSSGSSGMDTLMNVASNVLGGLASQSGNNGQKSSGPSEMDSLMNMASSVLGGLASQSGNNGQKSSGPSGMDSLMNIATGVLGGLGSQSGSNGQSQSGNNGQDYLLSMANGINSLVNSAGGILGKMSNAVKKEEQKPFDPFGFNSARNVAGGVPGGSPNLLPNVVDGLNGGNFKNKPAKGQLMSMIYEMTMLFLGKHVASTLSIPLDSLKVKMANVRSAVTSLVPEFKRRDLIAFAQEFTNNLGCENFNPNIILKANYKIDRCVQFMADVVNLRSCPPAAGEEENQQEESVIIEEPLNNDNKTAFPYNKKSMLNLAKKFLDRVGCEKPTYPSVLKNKIFCEELFVDAVNFFVCS